MDSLFKKMLEAKKNNEIVDIKRKFENKYNVNWRPVGDRENNLATINIGTDPASALVERITNGIDAILKREWIKRGKPQNIYSPRTAVDKWFGIKDGRLHNIKNARNYSELSDNIIVSYHDSSNNQRPTVDIRDKGCGIKADKFSESILGLNEDRKIDKFFLAGAFGQGGSTALSFSKKYTLIFSRPVDNNDNPLNTVAVTIVRFNEGNLERDKHGVYEYLVNDEGNPFTFNIDLNDFSEGTLVRHIEMDVGKFKSTLTSPTNGLYHLAHRYLFDPILPFKIKEKRENKKNHVRTVAGNNRRLSTSKILDYQNEAIQSFQNGKLKIKWWVIQKKSVKHYTLESKPIIITYNGQKQGELSNSIIKNELGLPYLEKYIIVHVDCDSLDNKSRRELFSTTRESLRDTPEAKELKELVITTLTGDDQLEILDQERKQRYISDNDSNKLDNIKNRLKDRVNQVIKSEGGNTGTTPTIPGSGSSKKSNKDPISPSNPPTFIDIKNNDLRKVYSGRRFLIKFKTDASAEFFEDSNKFTAKINNDFGEYTGKTNVKNGHGTTYFEVNNDIEIGKTAKVKLQITINEKKSISDSIEVKVAKPPKKGKGDGSNNLVPNINTNWVSKDHPYWKDNDWDETEVADVIVEDNSIQVYISEENYNLTKILHKTRRKRKNKKIKQSIKEFYLEHISFHAILGELNNKNLDNESDLKEKYLNKELKRLSETVCGIINQLYDVIATEATSDAK